VNSLWYQLTLHIVDFSETSRNKCPMLLFLYWCNGVCQFLVQRIWLSLWDLGGWFVKWGWYYRLCRALGKTYEGVQRHLMFGTQ
jgi:hypothetical protein